MFQIAIPITQRDRLTNRAVVFISHVNDGLNPKKRYMAGGVDARLMFVTPIFSLCLSAAVVLVYTGGVYIVASVAVYL